MIKQTVTVREVENPKDGRTQFEVYDSDTGTTLGIYDERADAEAEVESLNSSDVAGQNDRSRKQDADPADG